MKKNQIVNILSILLIVYFVIKNTIYYFPGLESIEGEILSQLMYISGGIGVILNILIAIWLFIVTRKNNQPSYPWVLLALFFGLIAVFTYYWRMIYLELKEGEK
jgi:hypothetical protein